MCVFVCVSPKYSGDNPPSDKVAWGCRGGSRNSLTGGGVLGQNSSKGGGVRVQVRGNFHILTSKKTLKKTSEGGGVKPPNPPLWIRYWGGYTYSALGIGSSSVATFSRPEPG